MDLHDLLEAIASAFMDPLRSAVDGVAGVGLPLVHAAVPLVAGLALLRSAVGGAMPHGALIQSFMTLGISIAALEFWPDVISHTMDQIDLISGMASGGAITDPFEVATAGGALAVLAFEHASAIVGYFEGWVMGALLIVTGLIVLACYIWISALSVMAWSEFLGAAVILGPLTALLPIVGFTNAAVVPISFLLSSTVRIVAISLVAAFGGLLIANPEIGLPPLSEEMTYLRAFVALGCSLVLAVIAWFLPEWLSGILRGMVGFSGGLGAMRSAIGFAASGAMGGLGAMAGGRAASSVATGSSGGGGAGGGGSATGTPTSTTTPVNSRSKP